MQGRSTVVALGDRGRDFSAERVSWLVRLRWVALLVSGLGAVMGMTGVIPGLKVPVILVMVGAGFTYNLLLMRLARNSPEQGANVSEDKDRPAAFSSFQAPLTQAVVDMAVLTIILWASGGLDSPFTSFYIFHVAIVAILGGPRWTAIAVAGAAVGAGFLAVVDVLPVLQISQWNPTPPLGIVADILAFAATLGGTAYVVSHAVREIHDREQALQVAREKEALEYKLLINTLEELEAGLEVVEGGQIVWRNRQAQELSQVTDGQGWKCPGAETGCIESQTDGRNRCRFTIELQGIERVYERLGYPIDEDMDRSMNLYLDRTQEALATAQLLLAERLASLGRVAQGVAHELNTPLATIRTLATDMRHVIADLTVAESIATDLDESAELIRDETRRLGRITHALLAGGNLAHDHQVGEFPLEDVVDRALALVTASRGNDRITVDDSIKCRVFGDPDRLVQVVVNLLQNALDASRDSAGTVFVSAALDQGARVLLVEDEGSGLDPIILDRLFEPFATTKPPGEGTGLGLYTSYMLMQHMGGSLSLDNREQGGAIARVVLPVPSAAVRP